MLRATIRKLLLVYGVTPLPTLVSSEQPVTRGLPLLVPAVIEPTTTYGQQNACHYTSPSLALSDYLATKSRALANTVVKG